MTQNEFSEMIAERMKQEQQTRLRNYQILNRHAQKGAILFTGSSLMEQFPICEIALSAGITKPIYNRGIGGTTCADFLREIDTVLLDLAPAKAFLNIGTNDITDREYGPDWMAHWEESYERILRIAKERIPDTEIYCMAYYPANQHLPDTPEWGRQLMKERTKENLDECNRRIRVLAEKYGYRYIDANDGLAEENGDQKPEYAIDGVHMYANGYLVVFENLRKYLE